jgi:hypothetical protein
VKVAVLSTAVHVLGLGLEAEAKITAGQQSTSPPERNAGAAFGILYGCFEFAANLYAQVTEVWCAWGCTFGFNSKAMVAGRHLAVPIVTLLLSPALYRPAAVGLPPASRSATKLSLLNWVFLVLVLGAMVNWYAQEGWCYTTFLAWLKPSKDVNLEVDIVDCWIPSFEWLLWGLAIAATIVTTVVIIALLPRKKMSWLGLPRNVPGPEGNDVARRATAAAAAAAAGGADAYSSDGGVWGSAGGGLLGVDRGLTTTTSLFGGSVSPSATDGAASGSNSGLLEDGLLLDGLLSTFIHDNSAESNRFFERQAMRRKLRVSACLAVLVGCVLGTGQAIGNQYWTIAEAYKGDDNFFLAHRAASGFLFPRMISSVVVGMLWDLPIDYSAGGEAFSASSSTKATFLARLREAWKAMKARSADGPHTGLSLHGDILVVLAVTMLVANLLFAAFGDSLLGVVWGFTLSGFATGAMNSLVPCLALEWFGRVQFLSKYSFLMAASIVGNFLSYVVIEHTDYLLTHRPDEAEGTSSFETFGANDDGYTETGSGFGDSMVLDADWGGCIKRGCYKVAFWIQAALMCCAVCAASMLRSEYKRLSNGDALRDIDDVDGDSASACVHVACNAIGRGTSPRGTRSEEAPLMSAPISREIHAPES